MLVDYLSCFAVVLRNIHGNVDICQTDYSIHSKLEFSPYSEVIHESKSFNLTKDYQRLKEDGQLFNLMILLYHLLHSSVPDNKCHKQK